MSQRKLIRSTYQTKSTEIFMCYENIKDENDSNDEHIIALREAVKNQLDYKYCYHNYISERKDN